MEQMPLADRIGVTHANGWYNLTQKDFMTEGVDALLELGTRVIKVWAEPKHYPYNSTWPETRTLAEFLQVPYCRQLFDRPFTTFLIEAFPMGLHPGTQDHEFVLRETQQQLHDAAVWLLKTYEGTGKTFILQNWEGDWAMRATLDPAADPSQAAIERMIATANARQAGVSCARADANARDVFVYQAVEANLVKRAMDGHPSMANDVFPHTHCDLYSYSAWDTQGDKDLFRQAVLHLKDKAPASEAFGSDNVFVGEFGWPENLPTPHELCRKHGLPRTDGAETQRAVTANVIDVALELNLPYVVYWQIYCNEPFDRDRRPATANAECKGFWLIRTDGTKTPTWGYLHELLTQESG